MDKVYIQELTARLNAANIETVLSASYYLGDIIRGNFRWDRNELKELVQNMVNILTNTQDAELRSSLLDNIFFAITKGLNLKVSFLPILKNTTGFLFEHYELLLDILYFTKNEDHWQVIYGFSEHENTQIRRLALNLISVMENQ